MPRFLQMNIQAEQDHVTYKKKRNVEPFVFRPFHMLCCPLPAGPTNVIRTTAQRELQTYSVETVLDNLSWNCGASSSVKILKKNGIHISVSQIRRN